MQLAGGGSNVSSVANSGSASAAGGGGRSGSNHHAHQIQQQQQQQLSSYAAAMMGRLLAQSAATGGGGAASTTGTEAQQQQQQLLSLHGFGATGLGFAGAVTSTGSSSSSAAAHNDASATVAALVHSSSDGVGPGHHSTASGVRGGSASSPVTTASGKKGKAPVLLDYTRDNPPNPNLLFVPKGTRQASVWNHMRLISTPESVAKAKRSGRDAVGLWCTVCQRVVHHGWTSGETNPVKRHCTEKRHLAVLSAMKKRGDPGSGTGEPGASADRRGGRGATSGSGSGGGGGGGGLRIGEGDAVPDKTTDRLPPLVPTSSSGAASRGSPVRALARDRATELPPPPPGKRFKRPTASRPAADGATASNETALTLAESKHRNAVQAYSTALVRSLLYSKVQMIRYIATDVSNRSRTKTIPLRVTITSSLADPIALPASTVGKSDAALMESAILTPDWSTMRIPPYSPDTALVVGNLSYPQRPADLCSRTLLQNVVDRSTSAGLSVLASVVLNVGVKLSNATAAPAESSPSAEAAVGQGPSCGGIVDSVLSPVDCLITLLLGQIQLQEIGVDSISEVDDSLQLELSLHESPVTLVDNVVIVRENMLHLARQHGLQLDFQSDHDVQFHLNLVDSETGQNLLLRTSGSSHARRSSSFVSQHDISGPGQSFLEGVLNHLPALLALTCPTDGSRPSSASWDMEGSSSQAPLRVTFHGLDYRPCSWSANLYLALSGIVTAGMDGMAQNVDLRPPASDIRNDDDDSDDDEQHERSAADDGTAILPRSFQESLQALKEDNLLSARLPKPLLDRYMSIYYRSARNEETLSIAGSSQGSTPP